MPNESQIVSDWIRKLRQGPMDYLPGQSYADIPIPGDTDYLPEPAPLVEPESAVVTVPPPVKMPPKQERAVAEAAIAPKEKSENEVKAAIAKKYGFGEGLDTTALKAAQFDARENDRLANLMQAGANIGRSIARLPGKADTTFWDNYRRQGQQGVEDITKLRQATAQDADRARSEERDDPNSPKATIYRNTLAPLARKVGMDPSTLKGLSFNELKEIDDIINRQATLKSSEDLRHATIGAAREGRQSAKEAREEQRAQAQSDKDALLEVPGYERVGKVRQMPAEAEKVRKAAGVMDSINKSLAEYRNMVKKHGSFEIVGEAGERMSRRARDLHLSLKELYELGVLNGPDLELMENMIQSPTSLKALNTRNDSAAAGLDEVDKILKQKFAAGMKAKGYAPAGDRSLDEEGGTVRVMRPDGKIGEIPRANLQKALDKNWKVVE